MRVNKSLHIYLVVGLLTLFFTVSSLAQEESEANKTIILGEEFNAGWLHKSLFGSQWRDLWTTPISIPILDLNSFQGGLTPRFYGQNFESPFLKFIGNDERYWKFTPINKDILELLPDALQITFVENILEDQVSSVNPFAKIISSELLNAVGFDLPIPIFIVLPEDEALNKFSGQVGFLESCNNPYEEKEINKIAELFNSIENENNTKVDSKEFLKIRLMNILLGNWDRNINKWNWDKIEKQNIYNWEPSPNNSDQALAKFGGLLPYSVSFIFPELTSFNDNLAHARNYTQSGRYIDRRFLTELTKSQWDSITVQIRQSITDDVIVTEVNKIPAQIKQEVKDEIIETIKNRRDNLSELCDDYYSIINKVADIYGSNNNDSVIVNRISNDITSIELYSPGNNTINTSEAYFKKQFDNNITEEIRIYLLDGDDEVKVIGEVDESPLIRIIGGEGKDRFKDESIVNGYFLSITPFKKSEKKTIFYDSDEYEFEKSSSTSIDTNQFDESILITENYEQSQRDRGSSWGFLPEAGYSTTDGVMIGGILDLFSYNFRKVPYEYLQRLRFIYAFLPKSYKLEYFGEFIDVLDSTDLVIDIVNSELSFTNYFGFGNENVFDRYLYRDNYYRLEQKHVFINPQLRYNFDNETSLSLGFFYEFNDCKLRNEELIDSFPHNNYGIGNLQHAGINFKFLFDSREHEFYPKAGRYIKISGSYFNELLDTRDNYLRAEFDFRNYIPLNLPFETTLALRSSGGKVWGKFPFYHAMFIGGEENVRAYTRKRFSGDTSISLQSEVRLKLLQNKFLINGDLGMHMFAETGRVFAVNQISDNWHPSFGVGIWASSVNRIFVFSLTYAFGTDEQNIYFDTRMVF